MAHSDRPRCFLDVSHGEEPIGRLTVELFTDKTPKTCENFRQLCNGTHNGLSYAKAPFHRVIDEFMIQGGDIEKGDGTGRMSIYGKEFEDENLGWRDMEAKGLVCSANSGPDTNGSQFFITLEPCEHLNGKHSIFGHLVAGQDTLDRIAKVKVRDDRPVEPVLISRCGELEKRKKKPERDTRQAATDVSGDRGRRRSNDSDVEMENSPAPQPPKKSDRHRRQSDNLVDEGLRGRPRQRSGARSPSEALSSHTEDDSQTRSPAKKHKRKRSPSPSRHNSEGAYERRRRSLPNQYQDQRLEKAHDDKERYKPSPRRDENRRGDRRQNNGHQGDSYRPSRDRKRDAGDGRLGGDDGRLGSGGYDDPPVKFKGRGVMKYRESDRF